MGKERSSTTAAAPAGHRGGIFAFAAGVISVSAEPFAHGLVESGKAFGVDEFLLVQWLAPLASEAPELVVALPFAWRRLAGAGLRTLVASKVNQWTLLIGTLGAAYSLARGAPADLPLDARQTEELFLTSGQSLFALAVIANFDLSVREALGLRPEVQRAAVFRSPAGEGVVVENVLVRVPGTGSTGAVLVVAHYDSVVNGPGAGDNGMAVAAMLETLRALRAGPPLRNDLIFLTTILWTAPRDGWLLGEVARAGTGLVSGPRGGNADRRRRFGQDLHIFAAAGYTGAPGPGRRPRGLPHRARRPGERGPRSAPAPGDGDARAGAAHMRRGSVRGGLPEPRLNRMGTEVTAIRDRREEVASRCRRAA